MDADKVEPLLFWLREFAHDLLFRRLGSAATDYWDLKPQLMENVLVRHPECAPTRIAPPRPKELRRAAGDVARRRACRLRQAYGGDGAVAGDAHVARFRTGVQPYCAVARLGTSQRADAGRTIRPAAALR
jgi:hypothetical protein